MCAGLLFSSVLTSEVRAAESEAGCGHRDWLRTEGNSYEYRDQNTHHVYDTITYSCWDCHEIMHIEYEYAGYEDHDFTYYWDSDKDCWADDCGYCGYTYYYD